MADQNISVGISLNDNMTAGVARITGAVNNATSSVERLGTTTDRVTGSTAKIKTTGDALGSSTLPKMGAGMGTVGDSANKATSSVEKLNMVLNRLPLIAVAMGLYQMAKGAVSYASDLTEVQNVVDVSFTDMSARVDEWAKHTLDAVGLNELSAKRYAGTMGAMLKSSGLTGDAVTDMSMKMTELSGDMASFYNISGDLAFEKIRSGISGETEPLKQLGINMSVANLEAYALSQGITTAYQKMTQAEQVQLRYNYLMSVTADAQGDFARTSDSYANQQKLLTENWRQFTGELVTGVLPILSQVMSSLNAGIGVIKSIGQFISDNWDIISPILAGLGVALSILAGHFVWLKITTLLAKISLDGFNLSLLACPLVWIALAIGAVIGVLAWLGNTFLETGDTANSVLGSICGAFMLAVAFIWNLIIGVLSAIVDFMWNYFAVPVITFVEYIANVFGGGFDSIGDAFKSLLAQMASWLLSFAKVATRIIDMIFGTSATEALTGLQTKLDGVGKNSHAITLDKSNPLTKGIDKMRFDYGDAWKVGTDFGNGASDKLTKNNNSPDATTKAVNKAMEGANNNATNADKLAGQTAKNTGKIKDSVDVAKENLVYMRDIAEKEAINKFTTAEVKVDMTNNNSITNGLDINSVVKHLSDGVREAMTVTANGVY